MSLDSIYQIIYTILADEATDEERHLFEKWLNTSETNRAEYDELKYIYKVTATFRTKKQTVDTEVAWRQVRRQTIEKKKTFRLPVWIRYAAMLVIIAVIDAVYLAKQPVPVISKVNMKNFDQPTLLLENGEKIVLTEEAFSKREEDVVIKNDAKNKLVYQSLGKAENEIVRNNHIVIPKGKTYELSLSDGTRICLNSETELIYPTEFEGDDRKVKLVGEAFFEVAKDKDRPFIVEANGADIEVLGTSFNVSCYANDNTVCATLIEGSVAVKAASGERQTIIPSEQFTYDKETLRTEVRTVDTDIYTSWVDGRYIFKNVTLEEIVIKLQRWYDFSINYEDESLRDNRYSLVADRNTELDKILEIISYTSNVKLERTNNSINVKKIEGGKAMK